ncbi:hypothetical protein CXB51_009426 [Gossypium anomalum]|uniref:Uncharacterized protein n=1 Tax=Gossypium anomalum TaxID=47600 RepID=A0A8J6D583_9ROSI|nr:hypothetical protein CXB51_009426 [Gossypium anomalum]
MLHTAKYPMYQLLIHYLFENVAEVAEVGAVKEIIADIENDMLKAEIVVFSLADKNGNEMAFFLAVAGVNWTQMFKA